MWFGLNIAGADHLQLRARRQIGYMAVIAALGAGARDEEGLPPFAVRGGVAIELLLELQARASDALAPRINDVDAGPLEILDVPGREGGGMAAADRRDLRIEAVDRRPAALTVADDRAV